MSQEINITAEQALTDEKNPLFQVWALLVPKLEISKADNIVMMVHDWLKQELTVYSHATATDDVSVDMDLNHCRAQFADLTGNVVTLVGWRLLLKIVGMEPHHPVKEVDCFFAENPSGIIVDIILSRDGAPEDQPQHLN